MSRDIRDSFPSKYLKASDLRGRDARVVIREITYENVGKDQSKKPVVYFRGTDKGLVLNRTNCNTIIELTKTPDPDEWRGVAIVIYPTETSFGGEQVECIRVRKTQDARRQAASGGGLKQVQPAAPPPPPESVPFDDDGPVFPEPADITEDDIPF